MNSTTLLHLNLLPGIGPATVQRLVSTNLQNPSVFDLRDLGLSLTAAQTIVAGLSDTALLEQELLLIAKHGVGIITIADPDYPALLRAIHLPPPVLYYLGARPTDNSSIGVVGSRKANSYGFAAINKLIPPLVAAGFTIISGGAAGIDHHAHQVTLDHHGRTVAVLGSGLLQLYPPTSKSVFAAMVAQGSTLLSSFPLTTPPLAGNFPARNRIIAGMSQATLVIQAAEKSGALITASFALEQGRDVFAVPGAIDDPLAVGCHKLIQQGAKLVQDSSDILGEVQESWSKH
jgi:DNA processing protein